MFKIDKTLQMVLIIYLFINFVVYQMKPAMLFTTQGEFKSDDWDFSRWPSGLTGYGSLDRDTSGFTRKYLNSLKEKIEYYGTYFENIDVFQNLIEDDPNAGSRPNM